MADGLPRLIVITDWTLPGDAHRAALEAVAALGPEVCIQHRDAGAALRGFLERARWLAELTARTGAQLAINGRLDVALLLDAHLHLPVDGPRPAEVRPFLPAGRWISAAVHSEEELAESTGCDAVLLSPVFAPGSEAGGCAAAAGARGLRAPGPAGRAPPLLRTGRDDPGASRAAAHRRGAAVQSHVLRSGDVVAVARAFLARR